MLFVSRVSVAIVSSLAVVASGLVGATTAAANPDDVREIRLAAGSTPRGIALGPDNNIWVTGGSSHTIARVPPVGEPTAFALTGPLANGNPWGIAAGSDGNLWFTAPDVGLIGRITPQGGLTPITLPESGLRPRQIALGSDGNLWFTEQSGKIGRVRPSNGEVTLFDVPWPDSQPRDITPGPVGSNRLYFTDPGADRVAEVYTSGQIVSVAQLATDSDPAGIAVIDNDIWFAMSATSRLGQLVAVNTVLELSVPGIPTELAPGAGDTMWISLAGDNAVAKYTSSGAPVATFPLTSPNSLPGPLVEGPDTNIWVTQRNTGQVARIISGQLPSATAAPTLSPPNGVNPGATLTTTNGTWDFGATAYTYKWQACASATDLATCADIPGATSNTYTASNQDVGKYIRSGVQGVNASGPGPISWSTPVGVGIAPPAPPQPVTGGQTVTIAEGVTLTLRAAKRPKAGKRKSFAVIANTGNIKGKLRITLVDSAGRERQVIAKGRWLKPLGANSKRALKRKRISSSLPAGSYTVRAVFTPTPAFRDNYPIATMTKPMQIRR
jgi:streptogramin lyase